MLEHVETKTNTHIQRIQWYNYMNPKRLVNGLRGDQTTLKISCEPCCEKTGFRAVQLQKLASSLKFQI